MNQIDIQKEKKWALDTTIYIHNMTAFATKGNSKIDNFIGN